MFDNMTTEGFSNIISTLVINGFHIHQVERFSANTSILHVYKYDKLGAQIRYSVLFSEDKSETAIMQSLEKSASTFNAKPIMVNDNWSTSKVNSYTKEKFFDFFGGIVNTGLILIPNVPQILHELGHNQLPGGLTGEPEVFSNFMQASVFNTFLNHQREDMAATDYLKSFQMVLSFAKEGL